MIPINTNTKVLTVPTVLPIWATKSPFLFCSDNLCISNRKQND
ncbi:hypothetical protein NITUZ_140364 [Candidatus Nitrosotenuis uzonensis]|uniref:Uncharacterized protein n=1 Tax=Candidatus Nitrosotenuis uzonensis TaxID=1407055 RepID=V6ARU4_9ARCH|nr:hypothetical protein NITUZ_140364 [Candidatus Nitrosotenuis uzonensis]